MTDSNIVSFDRVEDYDNLPIDEKRRVLVHYGFNPFWAGCFINHPNEIFRLPRRYWEHFIKQSNTRTIPKFCPNCGTKLWSIE